MLILEDQCLIQGNPWWYMRWIILESCNAICQTILRWIIVGGGLNEAVDYARKGTVVLLELRLGAGSPKTVIKT